MVNKDSAGCKKVFSPPSSGGGKRVLRKQSGLRHIWVNVV